MHRTFNVKILPEGRSKITFHFHYSAAIKNKSYLVTYQDNQKVITNPDDPFTPCGLPNQGQTFYMCVHEAKFLIV